MPKNFLIYPKAIRRLVDLKVKGNCMRRMLLHPTPELPDDTPVEQIRLPWHIRRTLKDAGLITVGNVRGAANETLLRLRLGRGVVGHIRATLGN
jgi:hypothetical protein